MRESEIQKNIIEALNKNGCMAWRANAGTAKMGGRVIKMLPKGFPDVFGVRHKDGKFIAIEIKNATGKPSKEQVEFQKKFTENKIIYGLARSVEDALKIVEGDEQ